MNTSLTLQQLLSSPVLLVVLNKSITKFATAEEIEFHTLHAWGLSTKRPKDIERIKKIEYVIGLYHGVAVSAFPITGSGQRYCDNRTFFTNCDVAGNKLDISHLVKGLNFIQMGLKQNHNAFQYLNC